MQYGFTTGSCAAAAAKAAAYMLLFGKEKTTIIIETPKGIPYEAEILDIQRRESEVSCAVRKDGGDDPDVTTGLLIYAAVSISEKEIVQEKLHPLSKEDGVVAEKKSQMIPQEKETQDCQSDTSGLRNVEDTCTIHHKDIRIHISGGAGVGRVTKPGLDQPVGEAAINHVPREMITKEVTEVCREADYHGTLSVCISVPGGEEVAKKTFNPRLGIEGGISIIGTSGIVEPMSSQALLDTIRVELNQRRALGYDYVAVSPGNYGLDYMWKTYHYDLDRSVKCSNFIGDTIDMAKELGFKGMLLTGHIGKLVKVSGGMMNTHSREGDCRMELLAAAGIQEGVGQDTLSKILDCVVTEEALKILDQEGKLEPVMCRIMDRIMYYLNKRAGRTSGQDNGSAFQIECILYSNEFGELARSEEAVKYVEMLRQELNG